MRILAFGNRNSGCSWHRVYMPLGFMEGIDAHLTNGATQEVMDGQWDMLLFNRVSPFDKDWQKFRDTYKMKVVMDMDDLWTLPPDHINYHEYKFMQGRIENNLRNADLVTVTHERLAEKCRPFNGNIEVIPNAIPYGHHQYREERIPCEPCRFFWAGGISHAKDIELLRQPMKRVKSLPLQVVIGGYDKTNQETKQIWERMISAFTCSLKIKGMILDSLPVEQYMDHWAHADVLLLPLIGSDWNGMKSNLKLLEAATKGIPVICSKVLPYTEGDPPVLWVERQSDWYKHVKALSESETMRNEYGAKLKEWAKQFDLIEVNKKRHACYLKLLSDTGTITTSITEQASLSISA